MTRIISPENDNSGFMQQITNAVLGNPTTPTTQGNRVTPPRFTPEQMAEFPDLTVVWAIETVQDGTDYEDSEHLWWKLDGQWYSNAYGYGGEMSTDPEWHTDVRHIRAVLPDGTMMQPWPIS